MIGFGCDGLGGCVFLNGHGLRSSGADFKTIDPGIGGVMVCSGRVCGAGLSGMVPLDVVPID